MKAHILIVEDEAILYERLRRVLIKENYSIAKYTPSVLDAISQIKTKRPDVVLLDIHLEGKLTGLDLGNQLSTTYHIPFIYVTQFDDNETFFKGLHTNHEHFIVKTKPRLNTGEVLRTIQTVLHKKQTNSEIIIKDGVLGLLGYLNDIKEYSKNEVTKIPVNYKDIAFFSIAPFVNNNDKEEKIKTNYLWFLNKDNQHFFLKSSLKELNKHLPNYFVRVNDSYIINLLPFFFDGRINGKRLSIFKHKILIKETYSQELKKRIKELYYTP